MDHTRFDSLTRSLTVTGSRRRALTAALSGALGVLGLIPSDDGAAAKKCPPCKKRKKGKCKKTLPDGTACAGGMCQGGSCVAAAAPAPAPQCTSNAECSDGLVCISGTCQICVATSECRGGEQCLSTGCCPEPRICGTTCLAAPCDTQQCRSCSATSGTCVSCSGDKTCCGAGTESARCLIAGGFPCSGIYTVAKNRSCCSGTCDAATNRCA